MKFDKQKAFLFAILGLALIAIIFGTSSIYADNQFTDGTSKQSSVNMSVGKHKDHKKDDQSGQEHRKKKEHKNTDNNNKETPMASVKPAPVTSLPQTGQFLHFGVTATGIVVLFLVILIVINNQFQAKLKSIDKHHEN
ncbi:hypothetical protein [Fructilactobacillus cliffordii]|uniref:Uncharacterized protein n=1 Tax=Fructilactobacillus cliffordii TaxID=2940299 RepID=A0A9Q8ZP11_9LACO|nr:hypothetical protein [Fructilactobacillus cliffordii]USS85876.1 hypothetical protein M3M38_03985 [Fructilactobacillus cliffordii]USS88945.1 hypothetical protein M3M40_05520 [Fructilactobacillus cliffordii]